MDFISITSKIFELLLFPVLTAVAAYIIKWVNLRADDLKTKTESDFLQKQIDRAKEIIIQCVLVTNQTYVDALKDQDLFDENAQKEAFKKTYAAVTTLLTNEIKDALTKAYGDYEFFIKEQIEFIIYKQSLELTSEGNEKGAV